MGDCISSPNNGTELNTLVNINVGSDSNEVLKEEAVTVSTSAIPTSILSKNTQSKKKSILKKKKPPQKHNKRENLLALPQCANGMKLLPFKVKARCLYECDKSTCRKKTITEGSTMYACDCNENTCLGANHGYTLCEECYWGSEKRLNNENDPSDAEDRGGEHSESAEQLESQLDKENRKLQQLMVLLKNSDSVAYKKCEDIIKEMQQTLDEKKN